MRYGIGVLLLTLAACGNTAPAPPPPGLSSEAEAWVQTMLTAEDSDARIAAHKKLAGLGKVVVPRMIEILEADTGNDGNGAWAAEVLILLGADAEPAAEALTQQLMETTECNATTSTALVGIGAPAVPFLVRALSAEIPAARSWAAQGLGDLAEHAASAVPAIVKLLDDANEDVQTSAVNTLASLEGKAHPLATDRLLKMLEDENDSVRWDVVHALEAAVSTIEAVRTRLTKLAKDDPDESVREAAAEALAPPDDG